MDHIGATILLAQAIVRRARIEHERAEGAGRVGDGENLGRGKVDDEKAHAIVEHALERRDRILAGGELGVDDREGLIEEAAGRVVVVHRHARTGDEVVGRRNIQDRDRFARMRFVDDADFNRERVCGGRPDHRCEQSDTDYE